MRVTASPDRVPVRSVTRAVRGGTASSARGPRIVSSKASPVPTPAMRQREVTRVPDPSGCRLARRRGSRCRGRRRGGRRGGRLWRRREKHRGGGGKSRLIFGGGICGRVVAPDQGET